MCMDQVGMASTAVLVVGVGVTPQIKHRLTVYNRSTSVDSMNMSTSVEEDPLEENGWWLPLVKGLILGNRGWIGGGFSGPGYAVLSAVECVTLVTHMHSPVHTCNISVECMRSCSGKVNAWTVHLNG